MTVLDLFKLVRKNIVFVIILPILCAVATGLVSWLALPNLYTSSVSMYVLTTSSSDSDGLSNMDLSASQMLTNDVAKLIQMDRVINDTSKALGMSSLSDYSISVASDTTTRMLTLSVTGESAQSTAIIANKLAETTNTTASELMDVESVNVIDLASEPNSPSGPPRIVYTAFSFLLGIFLAIVVLILMDILNTKVRNPEEIEELLALPVIGRIPTIKA